MVYTDSGDLSNMLLTQKNLIIGIDEGYFVAKNIDVLKRQVKDLADTLSAVRNRGHIVVICFIKFNRAAKTILEVMNYWLHKPNIDWGILYIRDREFIGDDPWATEDLLKAKTLPKKRWLLRHNPNYITTVKVREIPQKVFDRYEKYKQQAQEEKGRKESNIQQSNQQDEYMVTELLDRYHKNEFDLYTLPNFLETAYKIPRRNLTSLISKIKERIAHDELYKRMQDEKKLLVIANSESEE